MCSTKKGTCFVPACDIGTESGLAARRDDSDAVGGSLQAVQTGRPLRKAAVAAAGTGGRRGRVCAQQGLVTGARDAWKER